MLQNTAAELLLPMANPPDHCELFAAAAAAAAEEEGYIDMDISSTTSTFLHCCTVAPPPHSADFEFQMYANPGEAATAIATTISPADELFYKGKILPLHYSPGNNHTVHSLLQKFNTAPAAKTTASGSAPFLSCKLNAEDYFLECSAELVKSSRKKNWSKKLGIKLKATRDYLKSLFSKSSCSVEPSKAFKAKECSNGHTKAAKLSPARQAWAKRYMFEDCNSVASLMKSTQREQPMVGDDMAQRKSFSGAINWNLVERSGGAYQCQPQVLKRSSSGSSEVECSVQGAIAYCKRSQQMSSCGRKSASDVGGFCTLSPHQIAAGCEDKERPGLCRG